VTASGDPAEPAAFEFRLARRQMARGIGAVAVVASVAAVLVVIGFATLHAWTTLAGVAVAAALVAPYLWKRRRLLRGAPALVIDADGIRDHQVGWSLPWEEIERIEYGRLQTGEREVPLVGIHVRDVAAARRRLSRPMRLLTRRRVRGWPPVTLGVSSLDAPLDEIVAAIRRFYSGPVLAR
jgi:hypothetical protein